MKAVKLKQVAFYNMSAKERPSLNVGQTVRFKPDDRSDSQKGSISKVLPYRSYEGRWMVHDGTTRRLTSKYVRFSKEHPLSVTEQAMEEPAQA